MEKKKVFKKTKKASFYITATFNNTIVAVTDEKGNVLCWSSAGATGFKGTRKSTPFAATSTVNKVINKAKTLGIKEIGVYIKGPGPGREAALRALKSAGFKITLIADVTPIPHNGVRAKKKRRV